MTKEYDEFSKNQAAVLRGGAALYPTSTATVVRVNGGRSGDVVTTDGPFVEAREVLAGFYLIEAEDLDAAVAWAARVTAARFGVRRRAADQRVATRDEDRQETGRRSP
jgi:hypothetical protein